MNRRNRRIRLIIVIAGICITAVLLLIIKANIKEKLTKTIKEYNEVIGEIKTGFTYDGFIEVMGDTTHILALPAEYEQIEKNGIFLDLQKLFVYKRTDSGIIIMLQVVLNPLANSEDHWIGSINYNSMTFNSPKSKYGEFFDERIPKVEIATNSFSYNRIDYSITVISEESEAQNAATILIDFCNNFIPFIVHQ